MVEPLRIEIRKVRKEMRAEIADLRMEMREMEGRLLAAIGFLM